MDNTNDRGKLPSGSVILLAPILNDLWCHLDGAEQRVLIPIMHHLPHAWPSFETIAREANMGRSTAVKAVKSLEAVGIVKVSRQPGSNNHYSLAHWAGDSVRADLAARLANRSGVPTDTRPKSGLPTSPISGLPPVQNLDHFPSRDQTTTRPEIELKDATAMDVSRKDMTKEDVEKSAGPTGPVPASTSSADIPSAKSKGKQRRGKANEAVLSDADRAKIRSGPSAVVCWLGFGAVGLDHVADRNFTGLTPARTCWFTQSLDPRVTDPNSGPLALAGRWAGRLATEAAKAGRPLDVPITSPLGKVGRPAEIFKGLLLRFSAVEITQIQDIIAANFETIRASLSWPSLTLDETTLGKSQVIDKAVAILRGQPIQPPARPAGTQPPLQTATAQAINFDVRIGPRI